MLVICALVPYLTLSSAALPLAPLIEHSIHLSKAAFDLVVALSTGGYAVGTVFAVQLAVHRPARRLLIAYVALFLIASLFAATTSSGLVFAVSFVAQGLCTSLMLIAAVPPLVTGWPVPKMPITGMIMNLCVFGAVAIGPTIGNLLASAHTWRPLFWCVSAVATLALAMAILTFEDQPAQDKRAPLDLIANALALGGCFAAFYGVGTLEGGRLEPWTIALMSAGVAMIVALVLHQYRMKNPLMPVRQLATTLPLMGIVIAMGVSAAAFGLMELSLTILAKDSSPMHAALIFLPEFAAALLTAIMFGAIFKTKFTPLLALGGAASLVVAAILLLRLPSDSDATISIGAGLIGLGVGASVSPSLFIAGFTLRSAQIQRVFAFIELMRGVAAFLVAPILLFVASEVGVAKGTGVTIAVWCCFAIALASGAGGAALFLGGGSGLQAPDLDGWQRGEPAWQSPRLAERFRPRLSRRAHSETDRLDG
jgi:MFS family permease